MLQRGRLPQRDVALRAGRPALLPEVRPAASALAAEGGRSALPTGPAAGRPAHQRGGGDRRLVLLCRRASARGCRVVTVFSVSRSWLKSVPGICPRCLSATRRPVTAWQSVSDHKHIRCVSIPPSYCAKPKYCNHKTLVMETPTFGKTVKRVLRSHEVVIFLHFLFLHCPVIK